ncbi:MAG: integrase core domain-containing protein [Planctomycetes bacterium]|nr:integrase core domain-containing protein [Planctomycetota bacterium]
MSEKMNFINDWLAGCGTVSGLCQTYGDSRETGHLWIRRFKQLGASGLVDRSKAAHSHPNATSPDACALVIAAHRAHPSWGPKKLRPLLKGAHPGIELPALSTMGDILKRAGLVQPRRRCRRRQGDGGSGSISGGPNHVWCIDYKGQFRLGNGDMCYPLTLTDGCSRMILCCDAHAGPRHDDARRSLERVFRDFGLPDAIRSDNGTPFASTGTARLSRLSVWWLKLGIELQRIRPGRPQENGRHERMHRTLKAEAARPPERSMASQQARFDRWMEEFNFQRPHEALDGATPAGRYALPTREYPKQVSDPEYPGHYEKRRVRDDGTVRLKGVQVYLSEALGSQLIGAVELDDGVWRIKFGGLELATFDERTRSLTPIGSTRATSKGKLYKRKVSGMRPV